MLDVAVADEWVSRAGAAGEAEPLAALVASEYGSRSKLSTFRPMWRPVVVAWLPGLVAQSRRSAGPRPVTSAAGEAGPTAVGYPP
ncbi:hypothetical protein ADK82_32115 [Streptomyces sp. NRRL S-4]|nr:hypothetical protein ADK82_32115 [Streptomyces sp. NRRL S-4]